MRKLLVKILLRLIYRKPYGKVGKDEMNTMIGIIAHEEDLKRFPDLLQQYSDMARNQYLYTTDPIFKGTVLAYNALRDQILEKRKPIKKKNLTEDGKSVKIESY
jgi:hypothetical protein